MNSTSLGERLRKSRKDLGKSQDEIAESCGVSREMWGKYERDLATPGGEVLTKAALAGFNVHYILTGEAPPQETHDEFVSRQQRINSTREFVRALPFKEGSKARITALLTGDTRHDAALIAEVFREESLQPRQRTLLDNYEHSPEAGKKIIEGTALMAAGLTTSAKGANGNVRASGTTSTGKKVSIDTGHSSPKRAAKEAPPGSRIQTINAPVHGAVAGGNISVKRSYNKKK